MTSEYSNTFISLETDESIRISNASNFALCSPIYLFYFLSYNNVTTSNASLLISSFANFHWKTFGNHNDRKILLRTKFIECF